MVIGDRIKNLRKSAGLTQDQLAEKLGVHFQTVSKWERSASELDIAMLGAIANAFDVTIDELLGLQGGEKIIVPFDQSAFAKIIADKRKTAGLSQSDLAERTFVSADTVSKWEREVIRPDVQTLIRLADIFNVSVSTLYYGSPLKNSTNDCIDGSVQHKTSRRIFNTKVFLISVTLIILIISVFFISDLKQEKEKPSPTKSNEIASIDSNEFVSEESNSVQSDDSEISSDDSSEENDDSSSAGGEENEERFNDIGTHNHLEQNGVCEYCGWTVYLKKDDSVLMSNDIGDLRAEFYGENTVDFGSEYRRRIKEVYFSSNVKTIVNCTFENSPLTEISIPYGVTVLEQDIFKNCYQLEKVTIPESVRSINHGTFRNCISLKNITLPDSIIEYGDDIFSGCSSLESFEFPKGLSEITMGMFYACSALKSITIPYGVTCIGQQSFCRCYSLEKVIVSDSVTSIRKWVFAECVNLSEIKIGSSVGYIELGAFDYCAALEKIDYNGTVTRWGNISKDDNYNVDSGDYKIYCLNGTLNKAGELI